MLKDGSIKQTAYSIHTYNYYLSIYRENRKFSPQIMLERLPQRAKIQNHFLRLEYYTPAAWAKAYVLAYISLSLSAMRIEVNE